jgi:hypothetical protein
MVALQLIEHGGRVVAVVAGDRAVIARDLATPAEGVVRAKCLYALQVHTGDRPGPYADKNAEAYARSTARRHDRRGRAWWQGGTGGTTGAGR